MPSAGLIHFYPGEWRICFFGWIPVSMPSAGLIHFYGKDYTVITGTENCVNALGGLNSFLR